MCDGGCGRVERRDYFVKGVRERVGVRSIENDLYVSVFYGVVV